LETLFQWYVFVFLFVEEREEVEKIGGLEGLQWSRKPLEMVLERRCREEKLIGD
jgi:hypothetical protein